MKNYIKNFGQFQKLNESIESDIASIIDKLTYEGTDASSELTIELDQYPDLFKDPKINQFAKDLLDNPNIATIRIKDKESGRMDDEDYEILSGGASEEAFNEVINKYNDFIKSKCKCVGAELIDNKYLIITVDDTKASQGIGKYYNIYAEKEDLEKI